ncbi:hypothetical protein D3C80_2059530 [compost metagenome]
MGMLLSMKGLILPWAYHCASSARAAALALGSNLEKLPQKTPMRDAPFSKARFKGMDGMGPDAKPTIR